MSRIQVETFKRDSGGWVAVASAEGQLVAAGRCAANLSEYGAVRDAIKAYYNVIDETDTGSVQYSGGSDAVTITLPGPKIFHRADQRAAINRSAHTQTPLRLEYRNAGGMFSTRVIVVNRDLEGEVFSAWDRDANEHRTFRYERVISVQRLS